MLFKMDRKLASKSYSWSSLRPGKKQGTKGSKEKENRYEALIGVLN